MSISRGSDSEMAGPSTSRDTVEHILDVSSDSYSDSSMGPPPITKYRRQAFSEKWLCDPNLGTWVKKVNQDKYKVLCIACDAILSAGRSELIKHSKTNIHKVNMSILSEKGQVQKVKAKEDLETYHNKRDTKIAEITLAMDIVEHNRSAWSMRHYDNMLQKAFPKCESINNLSLKRSKVLAIIKNVLKKSVILSHKKILENKLFSVLIDESTDIADSKNLCILVKYVDQGEVCTYLLDYIRVTSSTADNLYKCLLHSLEKHNLAVKNIVGISIDNANVMLGEHNSVLSRLIRENKEVCVLPCICHSIHLIACHAAKQLPNSINKFLHKIYSYFARSSKRQHMLQTPQQFMNVAQHQMLPLSATRWLALSKCIERVIEQWTVLFSVLLEGKCRDDCNDIVDDLIDASNHPYTKPYLSFLNYALKPFILFNINFQKADNVNNELHTSCTSFLNMVASNFIKHDILRGANFSNINIFMEENIVPLDSIMIGTDTKVLVDEIKNNNSSDNASVIQFYKNCLKFYQTAFSEALSRFPLNDDVIESLNFLSPSVTLNIQKHGNQINNLLCKFPSSLAAGKVQDEWFTLAFYFTGDQKSEMEKLNAIDFWKKIEQIIDPITNEMVFKNIMKLVHLCFSLPHSNADVERTFSMVSAIKTKYRNRMKPQMVAALCRIKIDLQSSGHNCSTFQVTEEMLQLFNYDMYKNEIIPEELNGILLPDEASDTSEDEINSDHDY